MRAPARRSLPRRDRHRLVAPGCHSTSLAHAHPIDRARAAPLAAVSAEPAEPARRSANGRRGRPGYDLDRLLEVAVEVFLERGYDGTSMEVLSRRLGIAKSAIYHHVPSKEALLGLALDHALDGIFGVAEAVLPLPLPAVERLERLVEGSVEVLVDRLACVALLLRVRGNTETERAALARRRDFDRLAADLVAEAQAAGDVRADLDPGLISRLLFGTVNSVAEWYRPRSGPLGSDLPRQVCTVVLDGLRVGSGDAVRAPGRPGDPRSAPGRPGDPRSAPGRSGAGGGSPGLRSAPGRALRSG